MAGTERPPSGIDQVVVVTHRPQPEGWDPKAPFHFVDGVEAAVAKAQELATACFTCAIGCAVDRYERVREVLQAPLIVSVGPLLAPGRSKSASTSAARSLVKPRTLPFCHPRVWSASKSPVW